MPRHTTPHIGFNYPIAAWEQLTFVTPCHSSSPDDQRKKAPPSPPKRQALLSKPQTSQSPECMSLKRLIRFRGTVTKEFKQETIIIRKWRAGLAFSAFALARRFSSLKAESKLAWGIQGLQVYGLGYMVWVLSIPIAV